MRDGFVFYRSFKESLADLPDNDKLLMYEAISDYALDKTEPNLEGFPKALFRLIRPQLDANWRRYEAGVDHGWKGAEHGKKGGRPKKEKPSNNPVKTLSEPTKDKDKEKDIYSESKDLPNEFSFENIWTLYGKKGNKKTSSKYWEDLSLKKKKLAISNIPLYVQATPEKRYRKDFEKYIKQEVWNDELSNKEFKCNEKESKNTGVRLHPALCS
jgi:hypothetical protein